MVWDFEEVIYTPGHSGYTPGANSYQRGAFVRDGRYVALSYRTVLQAGATMGGSGWLGTEVPSQSNTTGLSYELQARFVTGGGPLSVPDYQDHGHCEMLLQAGGLRGYFGSVRLESASYIRPFYWGVNGVTLSPVGITLTAPAVWAIGDSLNFNIRYVLAN
jgi:hypothetical protein